MRPGARFWDPSYRTIKTILERGLDQQSLDGVPVQEHLLPGGIPPWARRTAGVVGRARVAIVSALHHLRQQLKTLKLSGMLDAIETGVAQAEDSRLGYLDFLEPFDDEIARRARNSRAPASVGRTSTR